MKSLRFLDRRIGFGLGAVLMTLGMAFPAIVPAFASAAQITSRSIQMSNSNTSAPANSVTYTIQFNPVTTSVGSQVGVTILFCNSATGSFEGDTCTAPSSFSDSSAVIDDSGSGGSSDTTASIDTGGTTPSPSANSIVVDTKLASTTTIVLNDITNPSTVGTFYARIETFTGGSYTAQSENARAAATVTGLTDFGGVALSATSDINVNAYVEEQMTFCVSTTAPTALCASNVTTPSDVQLGTTQGSQVILGSSVSTSGLYTQMSTNAANGAIVNLSSDATSCGGMYLVADTSVCGIGPETTASHTWAGGEGLFGLAVGTESGATGGTTPTGTLQGAGSYNTASDYYMNYVSGNGSGVTGPYGDTIMNTDAAPVANENTPITLAADAAPTTPAGQYKVDLNLIATGTF